MPAADAARGRAPSALRSNTVARTVLTAPTILAEWSLPRTQEALSDARHHVRKLAGQLLGYGDRTEGVQIAVGETLANAVRHGSGEIRIVVAETADSLRVEVHDEGTGLIGKAAKGPLAETGRGMLLVDVVTDKCGIKRTADGTTAWFEMRLPS